MRVRYVGPVETLSVQPAGKEPFTVNRLEWVDVDPDVVGKRPSGDDLGSGLLAQLDENGDPLWELESVKKAQKTRQEGDS